MNEHLGLILCLGRKEEARRTNHQHAIGGGVLEGTALGLLDTMSKPQKKGSFFRKWVMRQYWRMQQSQAVVSLLLWGTTITLLVWPMISWRFTARCESGFCFADDFVGISSTYIGLVAIFFSVMFAVLAIGFLYDQVFSLWTEWRSVDMERNPYVTYALAPIWVMSLALQAEILKRTSPEDEAIVGQADWYLKWCEEYTEGEMFARAVQRWDKDLGETPTFWFTSDDAMQRAREASISDDA